MELEVATVSRPGTSHGQECHARSTADRRISADLNYLFYRQQVERSRAHSAASAAAREAHRELAALYEERIERLAGGAIRFRALRSSRH